MSITIINLLKLLGVINVAIWAYYGILTIAIKRQQKREKSANKEGYKEND